MYEKNLHAYNCKPHNLLYYILYNHTIYYIIIEYYYFQQFSVDVSRDLKPISQDWPLAVDIFVRSGDVHNKLKELAHNTDGDYHFETCADKGYFGYTAYDQIIKSFEFTTGDGSKSFT